ncbi:MAG: hypothetical protein GXX85_03075 [Ignavibacteria bacterium]|nr:hypothetical protein [Ignavibacteria bacterium]
MKQFEKYEFIELHDARINEIITNGNDLSIQFSHIPVYKNHDEQKYAIWAYQAVLMCKDVNYVSIRGKWDNKDDYIIESIFFEESDYKHFDITMNNLNNLKKIEITMFNGANIKITCNKINIVLGESKGIFDYFKKE